MLKVRTSQKYFNPKNGEYYFIYTLVSDNINGEIEEPNGDNIPPPDDVEVIYVDSIQDAIDKLVGNAPPDRNTLEKISNYLDLKVDKINGYSLTENNFTTYYKEKLETIDVGANRYIHPLSHSADIIVENENRRFFTTPEREKLRGIEFYANNYTHPDTHTLDMIEETDYNKIMTKLEREKLRGIENGANLYEHPDKHSAEIIEENIMRNFVSHYEKEFWSKKADVEDIDRRIDKLMQTSSRNLETLTEISEILNDSNNIEYSILNTISNKQDKEEGKILSDQNFTKEEKTKLSKIQDGSNFYEHPKKHHVSMIEDLDFYISNHRDITFLKMRDHDKDHNINSLSNHEGVRDSERDNIVLFNDVGLFKDSKMKLPYTSLVGKDDEQTITKKKIENCIIGENNPSKGNFTIVSGGIKSYDEIGDVQLNPKQLTGSILYLDKIRDDDLFWEDSSYSKIEMPSVVDCIDGAWIKIHIIFDINMTIIPGINDRLRYKGVSNLPGNEIILNLFSGDTILLHKDSLLGWTILSQK